MMHLMMANTPRLLLRPQTSSMRPSSLARRRVWPLCCTKERVWLPTGTTLWCCLCSGLTAPPTATTRRTPSRSTLTPWGRTRCWWQPCRLATTPGLSSVALSTSSLMRLSHLQSRKFRYNLVQSFHFIHKIECRIMKEIFKQSMFLWLIIYNNH